MDILERIWNKQISGDKAEDTIANLLEKFHNSTNKEKAFNVSENIGMNNYEYTAHCQGIDIETLVRWRYKGWPNKCAITNKSFDYKNYGWLVQEINGIDQLVLL